jgi:hypothetical protein
MATAIEYGFTPELEMVIKERAARKWEQERQARRSRAALHYASTSHNPIDATTDHTPIAPGAHVYGLYPFTDNERNTDSIALHVRRKIEALGEASQPIEVPFSSLLARRENNFVKPGTIIGATKEYHSLVSRALGIEPTQEVQYARWGFIASVIDEPRRQKLRLQDFASNLRDYVAHAKEEGHPLTRHSYDLTCGTDIAAKTERTRAFELGDTIDGLRSTKNFLRGIASDLGVRLRGEYTVVQLANNVRAIARPEDRYRRVQLPEGAHYLRTAPLYA